MKSTSKLQQETRRRNQFQRSFEEKSKDVKSKPVTDINRGGQNIIKWIVVRRGTELEMHCKP